MTEEQFWARADRSGGPNACWIWNGSMTASGYGTARVLDGHRRPAHAVAYILTYGEPAGKVIFCHHCDVRRCINPIHVFPGTHADNSADCVAKNRQAKGERVTSSKLTEAQVNEIRRRVMYEGIRGLAREYQVSARTIRFIRDGTCWRHLAPTDKSIVFEKVLPGTPCGIHHGSAKLTEDDVREIRLRRANGETCRSIALTKGISFSEVSDIARLNVWKHIE
jgi:hypothetical protein